jgi:hypothetical protein
MTACTPFALSPPARTLPLERPAAVADGRVSIQAAASAWPPGPITAAVRARVGLVSGVEAQLEGSYIHHRYTYERTPHIGAARAGLKLAPTPHVAFALGLGAGSHTHGAFLAPDAGALLAYENPDIVPWLTDRVTLSAPVDPQTVVVSDMQGERVVLVPLTPDTTAIMQLRTGVRIPIHIDEPPVDSVSVLAGVAWTYLRGLSNARDLYFLHSEIVLEIVLDLRPTRDPDALLFEERDE